MHASHTDMHAHTSWLPYYPSEADSPICYWMFFPNIPKERKPCRITIAVLYRQDGHRIIKPIIMLKH